MRLGIAVKSGAPAPDVKTADALREVLRTAPAEIAQVECRRLALNMLDTIEDGKMSTRAFTKTKTTFARSCATR